MTDEEFANLSDEEIGALAEQLAESILAASPDPDPAPARCTCFVCGRKPRK